MTHKPRLIIPLEVYEEMMGIIKVSCPSPIAGIGIVKTNKTATAIKLVKIELVKQERFESICHLNPEPEELANATFDLAEEGSIGEIGLRWSSSFDFEPNPKTIRDLDIPDRDWFIFLEATPDGRVAANLEMGHPLRFGTDMDVIIDFEPEVTAAASYAFRISGATMDD